MTPVHQHTAGTTPAASQQALASINWPFAAPAEETVKKCIEIRGSTYLAYCKSWAPVWVNPDDEAALDD